MLEFDKENHIYLKDGVILKSVTQILKELFPSKYDGIPKEILENKSIYGTELHKFIEIIETKCEQKSPFISEKAKELNDKYIKIA